MNEREHNALQVAVKQMLLMEAQYIALGQQVRGMRKDGVVEPVLVALAEAVEVLKAQVRQQKRDIGGMCQREPAMQWATTVHGLGNAVALVLGLMPQLSDFPNPAKLWAYGGFAPSQGRKAGQNHRYSHEVHSKAIKRLAEPCMKHRLSPFRAVYDRRRAHTVLSHPEWTDGHAHNDALRLTAKAILLDMWLVAHEKRPRVGHPRSDAQITAAQPSAASVYSETIR